ncbi:MAG: hypothetical protein LBQ18_08710 [Campylobacteraceae bacterium]|nr:hypothetical protein [Campylobacteraceae bacterium]
MKNINLAAVFIAVEALLLSLCLYFGKAWLINAQVGFFSSLLIVVCSFLGYKKMITAKTLEAASDEPDTIEKIEDPYGVWDDENGDDAPKPSAIKTAAKDAKRSARGFFSLYRTASYALFFVLFLALVKSGYFAIIPFVIGISFVPLGVIVYGVLRSLGDK